MLTHMKLAGVFDGLCGLGIGSFENCGASDQVLEIIARIFAPFHIPILADSISGMGPTTLRFAFGLEADLDAGHHC